MQNNTTSASLRDGTGRYNGMSAQGPIPAFIFVPGIPENRIAKMRGIYKALIGPRKGINSIGP